MDEIVNIIISVIIAASAVALGIARSRRKSTASINAEAPKPSRPQEMQQKVMEWRKNNSHDNITANPRPTSNKITSNTETQVKAQTRKTKNKDKHVSGNDDSIAERFNLRDAVLYSEIMKPKFDE